MFERTGLQGSISAVIKEGGKNKQKSQIHTQRHRDPCPDLAEGPPEFNVN